MMAKMPDAVLTVRKSETGSGPCFWEWLALLFIGLRLSGEIDWSWWWVLSPLLVWLVRPLVDSWRAFQEEIHDLVGRNGI